ncbi:ECF RNA polymerase sigma factor SigE [bioreactor metagenome]|jgi:RNA polymerase sigma-70 factor, ECF subfamily|uniref:ECF RNA polymerase sigma factor SigE n=1 Tax=bioreactor metagenome TaxID=1076179 RepID=A0A644V6C0_9ZZZZ|nr:sigma-70 family RNA polymerase sigma factor [Parabacteroides sp.]MEA4808070.1 sigma-70 family RNA polymerase sigma factor [Macellibacteroides fermentans]MBP7938846.1 sigma-70 family RNA polymerase sigma factor [Parabacteroides sp.]MBP8011970.1 sigma-70 family RNA polymerase sigma factor [Parabacteroides sp.]MBP8026129.1 sigma-70 family RNA polymerase sigma factor [Parabacteroides sp.]
MELETFKSTVLPLRDKLLKYSVKLTDDGADAEDIVQEAFLKLWYIRDRLDGYQSVEALSVQVVKNLCLDKLRSKRMDRMPENSESILADTVTPEQLLEQHDAVAIIGRLIQQLPTLQQCIIRMKDVEGYELSEIAQITGTQIESVRVNLSRARKKVREQFLMLNR